MSGSARDFIHGRLTSQTVASDAPRIQAVFGRYLNVSTKLVQAWEANRRRPEGPALVALHIAAEQPGLLERVRHNIAARNTRGRERRIASAK